MSEKEMEKDNQVRYMTIKETFEEILDAKEVQCFRIGIDGNCNASTKNRLARISIMLPRTVVDGNLKDLDKYVFFGIAIPCNILNKL